MYMYYYNPSRIADICLFDTTTQAPLFVKNQLANRTEQRKSNDLKLRKYESSNDVQYCNIYRVYPPCFVDKLLIYIADL